MIRPRVFQFALAVALLFAAPALVVAPSRAQTPSPNPGASASPSASPSPTPRPGTIRWALDAHTTFVANAAGGPGVAPPEAAGFASGSPLSPLTPYDVLSSAPLVSGNASESALYVRPAYYGRTFDVSLVLGAGFVRGSATNAAHWGESLFAPLNPHLGAQTLPYRIVFPSHAGQDDATAFVASILSGTLASKDGALALKGGRGKPHPGFKPAAAHEAKVARPVGPVPPPAGPQAPQAPAIAPVLPIGPPQMPGE